MSAQSGVCGLWSPEVQDFCIFLKRGGVIVQDTELVVTAILSFTSGGFHISRKNSYPGSAGTRVLVCGKGIVILTFFEGGLLCVEN